MKEEQKKLILSVVGVLVLIIAVFGITYAFFNYTRTGSEDNTITAGRLYIEFREGTSYINITDAYPISDADAGQGTVFNFTVQGYIEGNNSVNYTVYAVQGDVAYDGEGEDAVARTRMKDYEVKIKLTGENNQNVANSITIRNGYDSTYGNVVGDDGTLKVYNNDYADDLVLATGFISSHDTAVTETHSYNLLMWISDNIVTIGGNQTTTTGTTAGSTTQYSSVDYEKLYYSMKINVEATGNVEVESN